MLRTLSIVISIGLADSLNPSTIGPALFLAGGEHPRGSVLQFALAVIVVFFLAGAVLVLGPGRALLALVPHPSATARYIVETVAGIALLVVASVLRKRRLSPSRHADEARQRHDTGAHAPDDGRQRQDDGERTHRRKSPALLGAGIAVVELPTAFPYFAAISAIISSGLAPSRQLLLVGIYDVCFVLPLFAIILVLKVAGERATETLARIRTKFRARWPTIAVGAALVAGLYVTALGVTGLVSGVPGATGFVSRKLRRVISR
jgi:cytochrome c biogenesis protein CcdA